VFSLTRRQAHAALAGVAAAAAYLAAAEIGSKKTVRVGGLFALSSLAMAGMVGQVLNGRASAKAHMVEARLTHFLGNGGSLGGDLHVNGDHFVTGSATTTGNHTVQGQVLGSGGTIDFGDHINMQGNNVNTVNSISGNGSQVSMPDSISVGNNMVMNGHDAFTFGHVTANQIGPGGVRADLTGTPTNVQLRDRVNYILNDLLTGANISY
jgi:hypothetical protein